VIDIRPYDPAHATALSRCAVACGQIGAVSAENPAYQSFVHDAGRLLLAWLGSEVVGFAGVVERAGASFLTDLFVDPSRQDAGIGRRLLSSVWTDTGPRMTSSSQDQRALALYRSFGLSPVWENLYVEVPGAEGPDLASGAVIEPASGGDCGWNLELPGLRNITLRSDDGELLASAVFLDVPHERVTIQVLRAVTPQPSALPALVEELRQLAGSGVVAFNIPRSHPALASLEDLETVDRDIWCATDSAVSTIDPHRELPSPAFG
jgi:GNAT superfamily N-acetyltransferase